MFSFSDSKILVSYAALKDKKELPVYLSLLEYLKERGAKIILDSGAYSAFSKGQSISLEEYMSFLKQYERLFEWYFVLDRVLNPKSTQKNFSKMLEEGFKPVPVVTLNAPLDHIDWYYNYSDMVGVSAVLHSRLYAYKERRNTFEIFRVPSCRLHEILNRIQNRKVHLLGAGNSQMILVYKPYSCDSTLALRTYIYRAERTLTVAPLLKRKGREIAMMSSSSSCNIPPARALIEFTKWGHTEQEIMEYYLFAKKSIKESPFGCCLNPVWLTLLQNILKSFQTLEKMTGTQIYAAAASAAHMTLPLAAMYASLRGEPLEYLKRIKEGVSVIVKGIGKPLGGYKGLDILIDRLERR